MNTRAKGLALAGFAEDLWNIRTNSQPLTKDMDVFRKKHPKIGARPGTLVIEKDAPTPRIHMIHYHATGDVVEQDVTDPEELLSALSDDSVTWVDVQGFGDLAMMKKIGRLFKLHDLLLEDVVNTPQRPKAEAYHNQLLMIVRMVRGETVADIEMEQVSVVLGPHYVITFQQWYGDVLDPVRQRIRSGKGIIRKHQSDYLAYAIVDTIIDAYYPVLESVGDRLEAMETAVIQDPSTQVLQDLNRLKNCLVSLRRAMWPQREAMNEIVRGDHELIRDEVRIYFRDTYDHCVQASEVTEMYREMVTGLMNTYLSAVANRTNDVMKVLTIVATIFIPLTFVAGIYGMNFDYMPELKSPWGYFGVWVVMLVTAAAMFGFFWNRGWIGGRNKR